jgi:putative hydrolase of the HAD superfamily
MIKAVIFDMGGVVCSSVGSEQVYDFLAEKLKVAKKEIMSQLNDLEREYQQNKITRGELISTFLSRLKKVGHFSPKGFYMEGYEENSPINKEVMELAKDLRKKYKVGMLTNTINEHYEVHRKRGDYQIFEEYLVASNKVRMRKPHKEIYLYTLDKMGVKPEEALFIDDKERNLETARKLGMKVILAKNPKQIVADVEKILKISKVKL